MAAQMKYPPELRRRAMEMYRAADPKPVIRQMARDLGVHHEALRNWIRQDEADRGERDDRLTTAEKEELAALRKENAERYLVRWIVQKYKRFRGKWKRAREALRKAVRLYPGMFAHWKLVRP
ncbi:transposase [Kitasatospora aureofaciens]|uniref:transposase n=1 Tax=Kitasatospora aureofaciens TaxID=1894 RepID=UPI0033D6606B